MINEIVNIFSQNKSDLTITGIYGLTETEYIVEAVEDTNEENFNDPFYKVDITTKIVSNYLPMTELDRFIEAVEKRTLYKLGK